MKYPRIVSAVLGSPWAILPDKLQEIIAFLRTKAAGGQIEAAQVAAIASGRRPGPGAWGPEEVLPELAAGPRVKMSGRVALVPVFGVIAQRAGMLEQASGGIGTEELGAAIDRLVVDQAVKSIVLIFDSPGGSVFGVEELGRKILAARAAKKIVAVADSVAASAAYWLASQASEVVVTPGGQVGSIGVLTAHTDVSEAEKILGIKTTYVASTPAKVEGAPELPLSEAALGEMAAKVEHYYGLFVAAVARGRGVGAARVKSDFGGGRMVTAGAAKAAGMVDSVATLEQVLARLGAAEAVGSGQAAVGSQAIRARALEVACRERGIDWARK